MKIFIEKIIMNYPYVFAAALFSLGLLTVLTRSNLFKKLIGINIMENSVFLFFIASANIKGGREPMFVEGSADIIYVNPLPSALMLTGIVVSVSVSAFALALIIRLYKNYGTTNVHNMKDLPPTNEGEGVTGE